MALTLERMVSVVELVVSRHGMQIDRRSRSYSRQQTLYFETGQTITIHENGSEVVMESPNTGSASLHVRTAAELEQFLNDNLDTPTRLALFQRDGRAAMDRAYAQITSMAEPMVDEAMRTVLREIDSQPYLDHLEKTRMIRDSFLRWLNRYQNDPQTHFAGRNSSCI